MALIVGLALALASSGCAEQVQALYPEIMGCEHGCIVAAAGWPLPYLIDYPGISVVGSASLTGALTKKDQFWPRYFLGTAIIWTIPVFAIQLLWIRRRKR